MKQVKKAFQFIKREWPLELSVSLFLAVTFLLLVVQLGSLAGGGASGSEVLTISRTNALPDITEAFLYYPYYVTVFALRQLVDDPLVAARLVSVGYGFSAVFAMLLIIKRWFSVNMAIVGATVFVSGSWFLQIARSASPDVFGIAMMLILFASVLWLISSPKKILPSVFVAGSLVGSIFVPFLPMLMLIGLLFALFKEKSLLKIVPNWLWPIIGVIATSGIGLFVYAATKDTNQAMSLLAVPTDLPGAGRVLSNIREVLAAIFWFAPSNPEKWLANLPLLDIFGVVMVTLGVYRHERNFGNRRSIILFGSSIILLIMVAINDGINSLGFTLLLPLVTLFVISGIQEFLGLWQRVFPRNPFARGLAVLVISVLVSVSSYYQLSRYFTAWANSPETREAYSARIEP